MIKLTKAIRRQPLYAAIIGGILLVSGLFVFVSTVQGQGAGDGDSGACVNYCTDNGFAWKKYPVGGSGPNGGLTLWAWSDVQATCSDLTDVWIHVVKNGVGTERAFAFSATGGVSASSPYSTYTQNHYYGSESIDTVHGYYNTAVVQGVSGTSGLTWGDNLEWFCYGQKPWDISVTSSVNKTVIEPGETVTWTHQVKNDGPNKTSKSVTWHSQDRGDWGTTVGTDWSLAKGTASGSGDTKTSSYTAAASDFGKHLCRATSASPKSNSDDGWVESSEACVWVARKPKVQVLGGDLITGRGTATNPARTSIVATSVTPLSTGIIHGSWSEYAIVASGRVLKMASAAEYSGGSTKTEFCKLSILTFSNNNGSSCDDTQIGKYAYSSIVGNLQAAFNSADTVSNITKNTVNLVGDNMSGLYKTTKSQITISGGTTIPTGRWVVINAPDTTVTITGDIRYANGPFSKASDIPQVVIIAKNIIIADSVGYIDSWLVAVGKNSEGLINTCGAGGVTEATSLTSLVCGQKLLVNGPVITNHLLLRRTTGGSAGNPAEVFNLRADAYIWASSHPTGFSGKITTVSTKELPPRF
ncbi:MAG: hypothetical protein WAQ27_05845 [Candidatus Microsaccharimonas sp.]